MCRCIEFGTRTVRHMAEIVVSAQLASTAEGAMEAEYRYNDPVLKRILNIVNKGRSVHISAALAVARCLYDGDDHRPGIAARSLPKGVSSMIKPLLERLSEEEKEKIRKEFRRCTRLGFPAPRTTSTEEVHEPARPLTLEEWNHEKDQWRKARKEENERLVEQRKQALKDFAKAQKTPKSPTGSPTDSALALAAVPEGHTPHTKGGDITTTSQVISSSGMDATPRELALPTSTVPVTADLQEAAAVTSLLVLHNGEDEGALRGFSNDPDECQEEMKPVLWHCAAIAPNAVGGSSPMSKKLSRSAAMGYAASWTAPYPLGAINSEQGAKAGVKMLNLPEGRHVPVRFQTDQWLTIRSSGPSRGQGLFADRAFYSGDAIIPYFGVYDAEYSAAAGNVKYLMGSSFQSVQLTDGKGTVAGYINSSRAEGRAGGEAVGKKRKSESPSNARISKKAVSLVKGSGLYAFTVEASTSIRKGEEILLPYHWTK